MSYVHNNTVYPSNVYSTNNVKYKYRKIKRSQSSPKFPLSYHHDHLGHHHSYLAKQSFYQIPPFPQGLKIEKLIATKNGSNISVSFEFVGKRERPFSPASIFQDG